MNQSTNNVSISGAGSVSGGEYGSVKISGSGKVNGDVKCQIFKCSGAASVEGNIDAHEISCSGACDFKGNVFTKSIHCSGSASMQSVEAGELRISGSAKVENSIKAKSVEISGGATVGGDISGETVEIYGGAVGVGGLISAESILIELSGKCTASELGGTKIVVKEGHGNSYIQIFGIKFGGSERAIGKFETVEGDEISLEHCVVGTVRGAKVTIGKGCKIGRVEYTESLTATPDSEIKEQEKV